MNVTTPYLELSPNFENIYRVQTSQIIKNCLNKYFDNWKEFKKKYPSHTFNFYIVSKKNTEMLLIKGPTVSKKHQTVDFSIFLPDEILDLNHYVQLIFEGIGMVLQKFGIKNIEIEKMKNECKKELGLV